MICNKHGQTLDRPIAYCSECGYELYPGDYIVRRGMDILCPGCATGTGRGITMQVSPAGMQMMRHE